MGHYRVTADAQHIVAQREETLIVVAKVAGLGSASRGAVLGIKIKNQLFPCKVGKADTLASFYDALEIRCFCSNR